MAYKPGESGNPKGRPRGTGNKVSAQVKSIIESILTDPKNVKKLKQEVNALSGRDMVKAYADLMPYVVPKLQSTSLDLDLDKLSPEQVDELYERIMQQINK